MDTFQFYLNSILLGVGLAMDAFSVSCANGLNEPNMKRGKEILISGIFSVFQFLMPLIGYICVSYFLKFFNAFSKYIPWISLILLLYIGGKMVYEGIKGGEEESVDKVTFKVLMVQGIATSIDALSVGFTIATYTLMEAFIASLIIGAVTFAICFIGIKLGKTLGNKLSGKATILGGIILIGIGIEIFVSGVF